MSPTVSILTALRLRICAPRIGDFELELTHNHGEERDYDLGDGYGHIALSVADLDAEHKRLSDGGHAPTDIKEFFS